jgi:hypothetical protein
VTIGFNTPPGVALGDAVAAIRAVEAEMGIPPTIVTGFSGSAQVFQQALAGQGWLVLAAVLIMYVVLGVLYESFIHPLTILSGLPAAALGAFATLWLFNLDLSVIAVIGVLLLIGLVKKNAIMVVDVALARQRAGESAYDAVRHASILRFRPILMTTLAAAAGAVAYRRRLGRRGRAAPAAGPRRGGRPRRVAGDDAVHHAGAVSRLRQAGPPLLARARAGGSGPAGGPRRVVSTAAAGGLRLRCPHPAAGARSPAWRSAPRRPPPRRPA